MATGVPNCISVEDNKESIPPNLTSTGTAITGLVVSEAVTPGKCAANPAIVIITSTPSVSFLIIYFKRSEVL